MIEWRSVRRNGLACLGLLVLTAIGLFVFIELWVGLSEIFGG